VAGTGFEHGPPLLTPDFGIDHVGGDALIVVRVSGEVDMSTAPRLGDELRRLGRRGVQIVVDLDDVGFMDCAGLRVLLDANDEADAGIWLTPGSRQVQKLFRVAGVVHQFRFVPRVELTSVLGGVPRARSVVRGIIAGALR
jgi:anti-anti-sigma factor